MRAFFVNNQMYMVFPLNSQMQGVSGKNEQYTQTPWREAPETLGLMQLHRLGGSSQVLGIGFIVEV